MHISYTQLPVKGNREREREGEREREREGERGLHTCIYYLKFKSRYMYLKIITMTTMYQFSSLSEYSIS